MINQLRIFCFIFCVLLFFDTPAQKKLDPELAIGKIDAKLLEESNSVIRRAIFQFEIVDGSRAIYDGEIAITILNKAGREGASEVIGYDPLNPIRSISGAIYDQNGKFIRKIKQSEIYDGGGEGGSGISSYRYKELEFLNAEMPYTYVFKYTKEIKNMLNFPTFYPVRSLHQSVQKATFSVIYPESYELRSNSIGIPNYLETTEGFQNKREWVVEDLKAIRIEPFAPHTSSIIPHVEIAPSQFSVEGFSGSLNSWNSFGKWYYELNDNRQDLDGKTKNDLSQLIKSDDGQIEKIRKVYEYMQSKTRYVSIQLGIGGWQTFPAKFVGENGYGDCKALTNYMHAMLKHIGIKSIPALVKAGKNARKINPNFPSNQFNHIILNVPVVNENPIWLECTSQSLPAGFLSDFTSGRDVLFILPEGGKLGRTPTDSPDVNREERSTKVVIANDGMAQISVSTKAFGNKALSIQRVKKKDQKEQLRWLHNKYPVIGSEVGNLSFEYSNQLLPVGIETFEVISSSIAKVLGSRIFVHANILNSMTTKIKKMDERQQPIQLISSSTEIDTVLIDLPSNLVFEFIPDEVVLESEFGSYSANYQRTNKGLTYIRSLVIRDGNYPAETYMDFRSFFKKIEKADKQQVVLVDKT